MITAGLAHALMDLVVDDNLPVVVTKILQLSMSYVHATKAIQVLGVMSVPLVILEIQKRLEEHVNHVIATIT